MNMKPTNDAIWGECLISFHRKFKTVPMLPIKYIVSSLNYAIKILFLGGTCLCLLDNWKLK